VTETDTGRADQPDTEEHGPPAATETASQVGMVLPKAVRLSSRKGFGLADALRPTVERAISASARSDPSRLVDALLPVVGPAFRRWTAEALRNLLQGCNLVVFSLFTFRGWQWRFEALRTGRTFLEVVRRHTSTWPVKQVLLIHRRTGLLLAEVRSPAFTAQDADVVSGMLTAIQDFVHDSFAGGNDAEGQLEAIEMGDMTVWIEQGPLATVAAVIDGKAPPDLRPAFEDTLAKIHAKLGRELEQFSGDTAPFERSHLYLEACMDLRSPDRGMRVLLLTRLILAAPIVLLCLWGFNTARRHYQWVRYVDSLQGHPGIRIIQTGKENGRFTVTGLRDPLAPDPADMLAASGLSPSDVTATWEPYTAVRPDFIVTRARAILDPPSTVILEFNDGVLGLRGLATSRWIAQARASAPGLAGVSALDTQHLRDEYSDRLVRWRTYLHALTTTPGIVVLAEGRRDGRFTLLGLRDPLARDPADVLADSGLQDRDVITVWKPYQALHPDIVLARAKQILSPPHTVDLGYTGTVLNVTGAASHTWVRRAATLADVLPGVAKVNTSQLQDLEVNAFDAAREAVDSEIFRFLGDSPDLWPGQKKRVEDLVANIRTLSRLGQRIDQRFSIEIVGQTTATDQESRDERIGRGLAQRVLDVLTMQDLDPAVFTTRVQRAVPRAGVEESGADAVSYVTLKVILPED